MKKRIGELGIWVIVIFSSALFLGSCDEPTPQKTVKDEALENIEAKLDEIDSKRALLVESILRSTPTLAETSEIFAELGSDFNREYLSDFTNVSSYTTLKEQGINLGVYLADLGYITTFEQSQEVIFYMTSAQKLAEGIGVSDVFDESTVERMEMNINDKDSVLELISELYWKTDAFLKELNRENISALIICGGWIEGMHIASKMIEDGDENDVLFEKLLLQHKNLIKILTLLETFEGDENIEMFEERLKDIEKDYANLPPQDGPVFSPEQKEGLISISAKIEVLRNEINQT